MDYDEKPDSPGEALQHYGVLGMKWGQRKKATGNQIRAARSSTARERAQIDKQADAVSRTKANTKERRQAEHKLDKMRAEHLKNPDRVISARLTRGEKWAVAALGIGGTAVTGGALLPVAAAGAAIAFTSGRSRAIEQGQDKRKKKR